MCSKIVPDQKNPSDAVYAIYKSVNFGLRRCVLVTATCEEGLYCACSECGNCVMVPGVSMAAIKIDTKAN